jgi:putative FmdB family regulatory protein
MPIYEYRCAACGHYTDALQKMSDAPLRKCPECGKSKLQRLVSAPQFRLKGDGWYETDFKGDNEKKRNLVEKGGAEDSSAPAEKSESSADAAPKEAAPAADKAKPADAKPKAKPTKSASKPAASKKPAAKPRAARASRG